VLKKSITYENPFTGMKTTEEFWFHISKAALVRMEVEEHQEVYTAKDGQELTGMQAKMQRIVEAEDGKALMPLFEDIIRRSYGRRDGDRFIQSEEIWADFKGSGAFDELLFELCTNAEASAAFVNGAMPGNLETLAKEISAEAAAKKTAAKKRSAKKTTGQDELATEAKQAGTEREAAIANATTDNPVELRPNEIAEMNSADLQTGLASGKFTIGPPTGHTAV
jgi:methionyl-tRNA synthetase